MVQLCESCESRGQIQQFRFLFLCGARFGKAAIFGSKLMKAGWV
jgi:hypothetical protein